MLNFYLPKAWKEQRRPLIIIPLVAFVVTVAMAVTVYYFPDFLTGGTRNAVESRVPSSDSQLSPEEGLLAGAAISQTPILAALFAGVLGANISIGLADNEVRTGAIEIVMSRGHRLSAIIRSLAVTSLILGFTSTVVLVAGLFVSSSLFLQKVELDPLLPWRVLVLPWPCLLVGIALGLAIQLAFPNLSRVKAGTSGNIAQLLALLPSLGILLAFTFSTTAATTPWITWVISAALILLSVVITAVVSRRAPLSKLLEI